MVEMRGALLMREDAEVGFGYDAGKLCSSGEALLHTFHRVPVLPIALLGWCVDCQERNLCCSGACQQQLMSRG